VTVETDISTVLKALVSNRAYADVAPANAQRPYITFQQVGGRALNFVGTAAPSLKNGRFQVNGWADTRLDAAALSRQIEDAMRAASGLHTTVLGAPVATYDPETKLYGTRQDYSCWF
jgi:hypothetical protein